MTPYCWTVKEFGSDVPPGKRALAAELQKLCRLLALEPNGSAPTQKQAADRLHTCETSLSRFLRAEYLPDITIVRLIHEAATNGAGGEEKVGITFADLEDLHSTATAEQQCGDCARLHGEAAALRQQASDSAAELNNIQAELGTGK